ncbi:MAG: NAD(+)/NADH kinase [Clostridia bacterium]|nr:NAD(+)/NADH kinase [Clostridia bacterium]
MKIAVIPNLSREKALGIALEVGHILRSLGAEPMISNEIVEIDSADFLCVDPKELLISCDLAIAIGGDGTIIHAAKQAARYGKATLGINAGRIGYLAGLEQNELSSLEKLISGNYTVSDRVLLKASVDDKEFYCLNDAVIARGALSRMVDIIVDIDGSSMGIRADGVVVATPTGSTAYSLSAGGPVVDPTVGGIVLSYICPQSPGARSVVLGQDAKLCVSAVAGQDTDMYLTIDGEQAYKLSPQSKVTIQKDKDHIARLISIKGEPFWHILSRKLK